MNLLTQTAPFLVAIGAVAITIGNAPFPDRSYGPPPSTVAYRNIGTIPEITEALPSVSSLVPAAATVQPVVSKIEASGCLDQLSRLPAAKVEECSQLVAEAVLSIAEFEGNPALPLTSRQNMLVEQLRLAAANVCRARWAMSDDLDFLSEDPACEVSTINLASNS